MKKISVLVFVLVFVFISTARAQQVLLDHDWYLAGEKITLAVEVGSNETVSKVAYVELADTAGLRADAVIALRGGRGQGTLSLPPTLHSGYYMLSMYTRMGKKALQVMVPVINTLRKNPADDIDWVAASDGKSTVAGASKTSSTTLLPASYLDIFSQRAENEGHCIYARVHHPSAEYTAMLAVVGKTVHVFQGKETDDSTVVFNTYGVNGSHPIVISAETSEAQPLSVDILNPFATLIPAQMPHLTFNYNRAEVEQRSIDAQMTQEVQDTVSSNPSSLGNQTSTLFSTSPTLTYNLDEYRQFRTLREVLLEYVNFVHHAQKSGRTRLYVSSTADRYGELPALVLLDGMPLQDIDRLLKYDARRVHYIYIYDDFFTFGKTLFKGVVNIITRTGRLTNFPPDPTSAYLIYDFPQTEWK